MSHNKKKVDTKQIIEPLCSSESLTVTQRKIVSIKLKYFFAKPKYETISKFMLLDSFSLLFIKAGSGT